MPQDRQPADAGILRAMAHPLRGSLLDELFARGPATATTLAAAVGRPVNAVSFHLRELARYGLIEDVLDQGTDRRERWWQPASRTGVQVREEQVSGTVEGRAAFEVFTRHTKARWAALLDAFFDDPADPDDDRHADDAALLLTPEEALAYAAEVREVMRRWRDHGRASGPADGRRTHVAVSFVMPMPTLDGK